MIINSKFSRLRYKNIRPTCSELNNAETNIADGVTSGEWIGMIYENLFYWRQVCARAQAYFIRRWKQWIGLITINNILCWDLQLGYWSGLTNHASSASTRCFKFRRSIYIKSDFNKWMNEHLNRTIQFWNWSQRLQNKRMRMNGWKSIQHDISSIQDMYLNAIILRSIYTLYAITTEVTVVYAQSLSNQWNNV